MPARAGEHTPPEHVAGLIHPVLAPQLPICVYPLAKTKGERERLRLRVF